nr:transposase [Streptomyces alboniger]
MLQFAEDLSDRAAAQAARTRIDWKYALGLELEDTGFDYSLLCDFRDRLVEGDVADRMLRVMLTRLTEAGQGGGLRLPGGCRRLCLLRQRRLVLHTAGLRGGPQASGATAPGPRPTSRTPLSTPHRL